LSTYIEGGKLLIIFIAKADGPPQRQTFRCMLWRIKMELSQSSRKQTNYDKDVRKRSLWRSPHFKENWWSKKY
jgi:hypothetical protein